MLDTGKDRSSVTTHSQPGIDASRANGEATAHQELHLPPIEPGKASGDAESTAEMRSKPNQTASDTGAVMFRLLKDLLHAPAVVAMFQSAAQANAQQASSLAQSRSEAAKAVQRATLYNNLLFLASLTLCLIFIGWVIYQLKGDKDLLLPVLSAVISLIAGAGGGYVFGRRSVPR